MDPSELRGQTIRGVPGALAKPRRAKRWSSSSKFGKFDTRFLRTVFFQFVNRGRELNQYSYEAQVTAVTAVLEWQRLCLLEDCEFETDQETDDTQQETCERVTTHAEPEANVEADPVTTVANRRGLTTTDDEDEDDDPAHAAAAAALPRARAFEEKKKGHTPLFLTRFLKKSRRKRSRERERERERARLQSGKGTRTRLSSTRRAARSALARARRLSRWCRRRRRLRPSRRRPRSTGTAPTSSSQRAAASTASTQQTPRPRSAPSSATTTRSRATPSASTDRSTTLYSPSATTPPSNKTTTTNKTPRSAKNLNIPQRPDGPNSGPNPTRGMSAPPSTLSSEQSTGPKRNSSNSPGFMPPCNRAAKNAFHDFFRDRSTRTFFSRILSYPLKGI